VHSVRACIDQLVSELQQCSLAARKVLDFFAFSSIRKALENEFGPSECWKLKLDVWKIPGIYLRFELRIMLLCMLGLLHTETVTVNIGILGKLFLFSL